MSTTRFLVLLLVAALAAFGATTATAASGQGGGDCAELSYDAYVNPDECFSSGSGYSASSAMSS